MANLLRQEKDYLFSSCFSEPRCTHTQLTPFYHPLSVPTSLTYVRFGQPLPTFHCMQAVNSFGKNHYKLRLPQCQVMMCVTTGCVCVDNEALWPKGALPDAALFGAHPPRSHWRCYLPSNVYQLQPRRVRVKGQL